jgi:hypothetical protein
MKEVAVKKATVVVTAIVMLFSFSQVCIAASQAACDLPIIELNIRYDGFCDGVRMSIDFETGLVTGNATGCYSHHYLGTVGTVHGQGYSLTLTLSDDSDFPGIIYVIRADGTWNNYSELDGARETPFEGAPTTSSTLLDYLITSLLLSASIS